MLVSVVDTHNDCSLSVVSSTIDRTGYSSVNNNTPSCPPTHVVIKVINNELIN